MRDPIVTTSQAMRAAIDTALADPALTLGQARVLLAVLRDTGCWSRLATTTCRARLAEAARVSLATVTRAVRYLHDHGVLVWTPSSARRAASTVALVPAHLVSRDDPQPGHPDDHPTESYYQLQEGGAPDTDHDTDDDADDRAWVLTRRAAHDQGATPADFPDTPGTRALDRRTAALLRAGATDDQVWAALTAAPPPPTVWTWPGLLAGRLRTVATPRTVDVRSGAYRTTPATHRSTA